MIEHQIDEVFAFLAEGENAPKFSSRVLEISKTTDGPPGVDTVYAGTVKDAGLKTKREFKITESARWVGRFPWPYAQEKRPTP